jgi:hypothetical protein
MLPASQGSDNAALLKCLSLQAGVEDAPRHSLGPRSRSLAPAPTSIFATTGSGEGERLSTVGKELELEDYLAVLTERKVRILLVSSAEMDGAVEGIRATHS